ncbi:MAG TPA: branched-chain amino acid ABC transporter permease [Ktedonobacterales bacterium]
MDSTEPKGTKPAQPQEARTSSLMARGRRSWLWSLLTGLLILGLIGTIPFQNDVAGLILWTNVIMFCCLAQAWNLIGGFVGYAAFGNVVFFGIGAYTVAVALQHHLSYVFGLLLGVIISATFAFLLGLPVLRLKGHYFAIATLGVAVAIGEVVEAEGIGGPGGEASLPAPTFGGLDTNTVFFFAFILLSALLLLGTTWLTRARFGYALVAIRENEQAAEALGIPTFWYKVAAFTLSAIPTALAGGIYAYWQQFFNPSGEGGAFDPSRSIAMVLMTFLGGAGTIVGPLIGGIVVEYLDNFTLISFPTIHGPLLGAIVILVTIFLPQGLIRLVQELTRAPVALEGPEAARVSYIHRIGEGVRRVFRFIASQGV